MTKIKGVKNWYCSLEMKENFGMRPLAAASQWMFIGDSGTPGFEPRTLGIRS